MCKSFNFYHTLLQYESPNSIIEIAEYLLRCTYPLLEELLLYVENKMLAMTSNVTELPFHFTRYLLWGGFSFPNVSNRKLNLLCGFRALQSLIYPNWYHFPWGFHLRKESLHCLQSLLKACCWRLLA